MLLAPLHPAPRTIDDLLDPGLCASLDRLDVHSRRVFAGTLPGQRRSKRRGKSVEFDDFRQYTAGDDLRHIDWNVFARLDRLILKLFRAEEDLCLFLAVDLSPSMLSGTPGYSPPSGSPFADSAHKMLYAARLAMALGYLGLVNQNRVSIATFGMAEDAIADGIPASTSGMSAAATRRESGVRVLAPTRGRAGIHRVSEFLLSQLAIAGRTTTPARRPPDLNAAFTTLARGRHGRGVMLVISDFLTSATPTLGLDALAAGAAQSFDVTCIQLLTDAELDPSKAAELGFSGDLALQPVEGGSEAEVTVAPPTINEYRRRLRASIDGLHAACSARGLAHVLMPTSTPVSDVLLRELRRRGTVA